MHLEVTARLGTLANPSTCASFGVTDRTTYMDGIIGLVFANTDIPTGDDLEAYVTCDRINAYEIDVSTTIIIRATGVAGAESVIATARTNAAAITVCDIQGSCGERRTRMRALAGSIVGSNDVSSVTVTDSGVVAFEAPSPPPPSPPPPSPPLPPNACTLDFLRATSYWQDINDKPVEVGQDGNLVHEFMEMERIMFEQYNTLTEQEPRGTNQPYVCRVAEVNQLFECLDIAGASTLQDQYGDSTFNSSFTSTLGSLNGNVFIHDNLMLDIVSDRSAQDHANANLFGVTSPCTEKVMGDGVINGFDTYVLAHAQFGIGPYATIGTERNFGEVATVNGRNDTKDRCRADPYNRLEWQQRIAAIECFTYSREDEYTAPGRRLAQFPYHDASNAIDADPLSPKRQLAMATSPTDPMHQQLFDLARRAHILERELTNDPTMPDATYGWSPFGLYDNLNNTNMTLPSSAEIVSMAPAFLLNRDNSAVPLNAKVFEYAVMAEGAWYWINVPGIHAALDFTILGALNTEDILLSNIRAPNYLSTVPPRDPSQYEIRFVRHREFHGLPTDECAQVQSSRSQVVIMQHGVLSVSQPLQPHTKLCGFDLMLWKPASTAPYQSNCPVALAAGSATMNNRYGAVQQFTACAIGSVAQPPPSPPPHSPYPPPPPNPPPPASPPPQFVLTVTQTIATPSEVDSKLSNVESELTTWLATKKTELSASSLSVSGITSRSITPLPSPSPPPSPPPPPPPLPSPSKPPPLPSPPDVYTQPYRRLAHSNGHSPPSPPPPPSPYSSSYSSPYSSPVSTDCATGGDRSEVTVSFTGTEQDLQYLRNCMVNFTSFAQMDVATDGFNISCGTQLVFTDSVWIAPPSAPPTSNDPSSDGTNITVIIIIAVVLVIVLAIGGWMCMKSTKGDIRFSTIRAILPGSKAVVAEGGAYESLLGNTDVSQWTTKQLTPRRR